MKYLYLSVALFVYFANVSEASELKFDGFPGTIKRTEKHLLDGFYEHFRLSLIPDRDYASGELIYLNIYADNLEIDDSRLVLPLSIEFLDFVEMDDRYVLRFLILDDIEAKTNLLLRGMTLVSSGMNYARDVKALVYFRILTIDGPLDLDFSPNITLIKAIKGTDPAFQSHILGAFDRKLLLDGQAQETYTDTVTFIHSVTEEELSQRNRNLSNNYNFRYHFEGDFRSFLKPGDVNEFEDHVVISASSEGQDLNINNIEITNNGKNLQFEVNHLFNREIGITFSTPANLVVPQQIEANVQIEMQYGFNDIDVTWVNTLEATPAGKWAWAGRIFNIANMPFGSEYSQLITVTNKSTQNVQFDLVLYSTTSQRIVVSDALNIEAGRVKNISSQLREYVNSAGISGLVSFDLIADTKLNSLSVDALYYNKADGDRAVLQVK